MTNKYRANWSGSYPCLCSGEWTLFKNEIEIKEPIPFQNNPANTYGVYSEWHFDENWIEQFEDYEDGLLCTEWCKEYKDYLSKIAPMDEWDKIYYAFQENDWRHCECGGCI